MTDQVDNAYGPVHVTEPLALRLSEGLGQLVEAAGMVNYLNHGAASNVYSEGCHGVTQEHLERFAELVRSAERERWIAALEKHALTATAVDAMGLLSLVAGLSGPNA